MSQQPPAAEPSLLDQGVQYVLRNKLKCVVTTWAAGLSGCMVYEWTRPTPASLKIIHSRVYAQALTLAALGAVAGIEMYAAAGKQAPARDKHGY